MPARIVLDQAAIERVLASPAGPVFRYIDDVGRKVENQAKIDAPVDTGNLRALHQRATTVAGEIVTTRVGSSADYAWVVHEGHGVILPKNGKVLVFKVGGKKVFVTRVGPVAGNPWLERALKEVTGLTLIRTAS